MAITNPYADILAEVERQQNANNALAEQQKNEQAAYIQSQVDQAIAQNQANLDNAAQQSNLNYQTNYNAFPFMNTSYGIPEASVGALTSLTNAGQNSYTGILNTQRQGDYTLNDVMQNANPYLDLILAQNKSNILNQSGEARNTGLVGQAQFGLDEEEQARSLNDLAKQLAEVNAAAEEARAERARQSAAMSSNFSKPIMEARTEANSNTTNPSSNLASDQDIQNYINAMFKSFPSEGTAGFTADPSIASGGGYYIARPKDRQTIYQELTDEQMRGRLSAAQVDYIANTLFPGGAQEYWSFLERATS